MKRFEYCFLDEIWRDHSGLGGYESIKFSNGQIIDVKGKQLQNILGELGEDGWEMIGSGVVNEGLCHVIYFKREMK
jgi:hypothetical protein